MLKAKRFQSEKIEFFGRTGKNLWIVEVNSMDWIVTGCILSICYWYDAHPGVLLDSGEFGQYEKHQKNSLTDIPRCSLISDGLIVLIFLMFRFKLF